jgi:hypothetical protein
MQEIMKGPCVVLITLSTSMGRGRFIAAAPAGAAAAAAADLVAAAALVAAELRRKWFVQSSQCTSDDMGTNGSGQLHLTQAWSVFMIVASGAAVALLLAAGEMLYYRRIYTRECTGVRLYITYVHHLCT